MQNTQNKTISVLVERKVKHPVLENLFLNLKSTRFIMKVGLLILVIR